MHVTHAGVMHALKQSPEFFRTFHNENPLCRNVYGSNDFKRFYLQMIIYTVMIVSNAMNNYHLNRDVLSHEFNCSTGSAISLIFK